MSIEVYELQKSKESWAFGKMEISGVDKCVRSFLQLGNLVTATCCTKLQMSALVSHLTNALNTPDLGANRHNHPPRKQNLILSKKHNPFIRIAGQKEEKVTNKGEQNENKTYVWLGRSAMVGAESHVI
ncbi:hypothetical protein VULLAG_LOCUS8363 [Vulpes lagopus]